MNPAILYASKDSSGTFLPFFWDRFSLFRNCQSVLGGANKSTTVRERQVCHCHQMALSLLKCLLKTTFQGTGEYINTKFFCRVCSMLHEPRALSHPHSYADFNEWWRGKGTCINGSWRKYEKALQNYAASSSSSSTTPKKVLEEDELAA